jgi:hypothetical protein
MDNIVYVVTTEYADEPTCNTQEYFETVPPQYDYLSPILTAPEFDRLTFTVDTTRVVIRAIRVVIHAI